MEQVTDNQEQSRFELHVDGRLAAYSDYESEPGTRAFVHTVTKEEFQGQGLAGKLAAASLDATRAEGLLVAPYCPYVRGYIKKHPEYQDLIAEDRREEFELA